MVVIAGLFTAFAVVAAAVIDRNSATRQIDRQQAVAAQMQRISTALLNFSLRNTNRYPCPAAYNLITTDINYGLPVSGCESGTPGGIDILRLTNNSTASNVIRGIVPFSALASYGLNPLDVVDPWGNRIMYIVHRQLTPGGSGTATRGNGAATTDRPVVTEAVANTALNAPDFVLVSYGRDALGAIPAGATAAAISCPAVATVPREENCDGNLVFLTRPAYVHSNASLANYFDDALSFFATQ